MPAGAHLSSPGNAGPRSQHWSAKFLAQGLGFFGSGEVTICLRAPASWPPPKEESLYPSLEDSGVKHAGKLLAATRHHQNAILFSPWFWERAREATRPLLLGHKENQPSCKSPLGVNKREKMAKMKGLCSVPDLFLRALFLFSPLQILSSFLQWYVERVPIKS